MGLFVYRELKPRELFRILTDAMLTTTKIMIIVGAVKVFGLVLTFYNVPVLVAQGITGLTTNPLLVTLLLEILFVCFFLGLVTFLPGLLIP